MSTGTFQIADGPTITATIASNTDSDCPTCGFSHRAVGWRMISSSNRGYAIFRCPTCKNHLAVFGG